MIAVDTPARCSPIFKAERLRALAIGGVPGLFLFIAAVAFFRGKGRGPELQYLADQCGARLRGLSRPGRAAQTARAQKRALDIQPVIDELRSAGMTTLNGLAKARLQYLGLTAR
jgi:hypothetical protein